MKIQRIPNPREKVKKFKPGKTVDSFDELDVLINRGRWLMLRGVPKHPRVIDNMSICTIRAFIIGEHLRIAEKTGKEGS